MKSDFLATVNMISRTKIENTRVYRLETTNSNIQPIRTEAFKAASSNFNTIIAKKLHTENQLVLLSSEFLNPVYSVLQSNYEEYKPLPSIMQLIKSNQATKNIPQQNKTTRIMAKAINDATKQPLPTRNDKVATMGQVNQKMDPIDNLTEPTIEPEEVLDILNITVEELEEDNQFVVEEVLQDVSASK